MILNKVSVFFTIFPFILLTLNKCTFCSIFQNRGSQPGVHVPLGVREKLTEGTPNFRNHSKQVYLGIIFYLGGMRRGRILIWGYAEGYNPDQGYVSTKRLRTPVLECYSRYWRLLKLCKEYNFCVIFCITFKVGQKLTIEIMQANLNFWSLV